MKSPPSLRSAVVNPMIIFALLFVVVTLDAETEIPFFVIYSTINRRIESIRFSDGVLSRLKAEGK